MESFLPPAFIQHKMSFLIHDMSPVDPLVLAKQPRTDMTELSKTLRRPGAEPISHERHKECTSIHV